MLDICKLLNIKHLRSAAGPGCRKSLIYNALLTLPARKKLGLACNFFLDTHGERRAASCLANASLNRASEWACVDCHNNFAHVKMMSANVIKGMANAMTAQGHHHKGKRPSFFSYSSRRFSSTLSSIRGENNCIFMLVDSKRDLLIFYCVQLYSERGRNATQ